MLVAITGGTGFVGSHTVVRLLAHGHVPRLLVRSPAKAARVLGQSGLASVYSMLDGFDPEPGGKLGPGWKASGLPWSLHLTPGQIYVSPTM